jgi:D-threo-aldose 1-dehydrogenase
VGRRLTAWPRAGLGTAAIGGLFTAVEESAAVATVERAYERGLRFFDTAPLYGLGLSERRLGSVLAPRPRDDFVLATKVGRLLRADAPPDPGQSFWEGEPGVNPTFDFSFDGVLRSVEESVERLGLDRIDVLHIHDPDEHQEEALTGAYPALDRLRGEGVIAAVGVGTSRVDVLARFARAADLDCVLVAGRYTLLDQAALPELLPLCREHGIAVIVGGVFNSGILADPSPGATFDYRPAPAERLAWAQRLKSVCDRHGVSLMAAALQFPLAHPAVATVLLGARSPCELDQSLELLSVAIPSDVWADLRREGLLREDAPTP